jgi:hypothetical protein
VFLRALSLDRLSEPHCDVTVSCSVIGAIVAVGVPSVGWGTSDTVIE